MKNLLTILLLTLGYFASAQIYAEDAAMYNRYFVSGTARTVGAGGAFGSVGADLGSVSLNPAGLGLYRSSDVSASPGFAIGRNSADYMGSNMKANYGQFYFGQAGFAFTHRTKNTGNADEISFTNPKRLRSFTIAINFQRQNTFGRNVRYAAISNDYSTIDAYTDYLNNTNLPLTESNYSNEILYARYANLIGYNDISGTYFSNVKAPVDQLGTIEMRGARNDVDIAGGFNFNDKVYFGLGIGIPIIRYNIYSSFRETNLADTASLFYSYFMSNQLRVSGAGVNARIGFIYRPVNWMRVGLAYQMPTFYRLTENYVFDIEADYDTAVLVGQVPSTAYRYNLRSPMKGVASASFYIKQHAFISVDYELLNYGASRVNLGSDYKSLSKAENDYIKANYAFGHNIRAGIEGAFKVLRLRAGYMLSTTPYKSSVNTQGSYNQMRNYITAGLGYRGRSFYADVAYVYGFYKDISPTIGLDYVTNRVTAHQLLFTLGFRFGRDRDE